MAGVNFRPYCSASDRSSGVRHFRLPPSLPGRTEAGPSPLLLDNRIPEIDVRASAGPGALNEGLEETKEMWFFPDPVIRHEFRAQPADLRMITIDGDSMEPLNAQYSAQLRPVRAGGDW